MSISTWWRGRGQHRAADRIPVLTHERDLWLMLALIQAHQLDYRARQLTVANGQTEQLVAKVDAFMFENEALRGAYDELFARHQAATSVSVPAPADHRLAILPYDPEATVEQPAVLPLRFAPFAPNQQSAA